MGRPLTLRIIVLSIFWITLTLAVTAVMLTWLYRVHIEQHYDAHVFTHLEELVAAVGPDANGESRLYSEPSDPRFHQLGSGWYWQIMQLNAVLAKSASLGDRLLNVSNVNFEEDHDVRQVVGPNGQNLRAHVVHMSSERLDLPVTVLATAPEMEISEDVSDFLKHIILSFTVLAIGLSLAVVLQVIIALKPLKLIRTSIADVHAGRIDRLPRTFPRDVQPVVDEVNALIDHNETLLKRARTRLADLAHAVKTPLTIILNESRNMSGERGHLVLDQAHVMGRSIDHYLSQARISGQKGALSYRTSIKSVVDDLRFAVERIYRDRDLVISLCSKGDCRFRGEVQDLEEMIGNLLDNACKWASSTVELRCRMYEDRLVLTIEDDGPGIDEADYGRVIQRGGKLDESIPGHGQGLSIVKDISDLYGGSLTLGRSELGGLKADLDLPAAE